MMAPELIMGLCGLSVKNTRSMCISWLSQKHCENFHLFQLWRWHLCTHPGVNEPDYPSNISGSARCKAVFVHCLHTGFPKYFCLWEKVASHLTSPVRFHWSLFQKAPVPWSRVHSECLVPWWPWHSSKASHTIAGKKRHLCLRNSSCKKFCGMLAHRISMMHVWVEQVCFHWQKLSKKTPTVPNKQNQIPHQVWLPCGLQIPTPFHKFPRSQIHDSKHFFPEILVTQNLETLPNLRANRSSWRKFWKKNPATSKKEKSLKTKPLARLAAKTCPAGRLYLCPSMVHTPTPQSLASLFAKGETCSASCKKNNFSFWFLSIHI